MAIRVHYTYYVAIDFSELGMKPIIKYGPYESKQIAMNLAKALDEAEMYTYVVLENRWTYNDAPLECQNHDDSEDGYKIIRV